MDVKPSVSPSFVNLMDHEDGLDSFMNFTDDMYEVIQGDGENNHQGHCMDSMDDVGQSYRMVHGYISLLVCIAGIFMNILIIMVLTRKEMRTPINRMLTALATADIIVMVEYIPFTLHMYVFDLPKEEQYSYSWAVFVLIHSHLTQILHTINIQLTISMSIWRYMALKGTGKTSSGLTLTKCNICILAAYICPILICIPNYLTFSIYHRERLYLKVPYNIIFKREEISSTKNFLKLCWHTGQLLSIPLDCQNAVARQDWYTVGLSGLARANNGLLHRINFWTFSVFVKIIPCIVLTTFMVWLVKTLYEAKRRHKMLQERKSTAGLPNNQASMKKAATVEINNKENMTTGYKKVNSEMPADHEHGIKNEARTMIMLSTATCENSLQGSQISIPSIISNNDLHKQQQQQISIPHENNNATHLRSSFDHEKEQQSHSTDQLNVTGRPSANSCNNATGIASSTITMNNVDKNKGNETQGLLSSSSCTNINQGTEQKRLSSTSLSKAVAPTLTAKTTTPPVKKSGKRGDRTSKLLIAVLCLFLITEIPQGIMALLSGIYGESFFRQCYSTWAEVWDILALINSAINFILYCFMSKQFRLQFHSIFKPSNLKCIRGKQPRPSNL